MSRPINITDDLIDEYVNEFREMLKKNEYDKNDSFHFSKKVNTGQRAEVIFSAKAYLKIKLLVNDFNKEVQWHGIVERLSENSFRVNDILVFPHEITGCTVTSNQEEYEKWLDELDDETFNSLRFHGHSHVHMTCNPSGVDMAYRLSMVRNIAPRGQNPFYLFMIFNKKDEFTGEIYDVENNVLYNQNDIDVNIELDDEFGYSSVFLTMAHLIATEPEPKPRVNNTTTPPATPQQEKPAQIGFQGTTPPEPAKPTPSIQKEKETSKRWWEKAYGAHGIHGSEDSDLLDEYFID